MSRQGDSQPEWAKEMENGQWPTGMSTKADPKLAWIAANLWPAYIASTVAPIFATTGNFTKGMLGAALGAGYVVMNRILFNHRSIKWRGKRRRNKVATTVEDLTQYRPKQAGAGVLKSAALAAAIAWPSIGLYDEVSTVAHDAYKYSGLEKVVGRVLKLPTRRKNYDPLNDHTMRFDLAYPMDEDSHVTDYFGRRGGKHKGTDISSYGTDSSGNGMCEGKPIYAAADGYVEKAGWCINGYGNHANGNEILINHGIVEGKKVKTRYLHLKKGSLEVPEDCNPKSAYQVEKGEKIAECGGTGVKKNGKSSVTGPHLHFEVYINGKQVTPFEKK